MTAPRHRSAIVALLGLPAALASSGCPAPAPVEVRTGELVVGFDAVPASDGGDGEDGEGVTAFDLAVDALVVDGDGPSGPESVAVLGDRWYSPLSDPDADGISVALELGDHRDLELEVIVGAPVGAGLVATGRLGERAVRIEVDAVSLRFDRAALSVVSDDPVLARVVFDASGWLDGVDDHGDGDDEDVLVIDSSAGSVYDDVVDDIVGSTRLVFGPAPEPAASSEDR